MMQSTIISSMTAVRQLHVLQYSVSAGKCIRKHAPMREREIERKLVNAVKERGGICWKFTSPGTAGVPDRIILMPEGRIAFVEVKAPSEEPRKLQLSRHKLLRRLGFQVFILIDLQYKCNTKKE